MLLVYSFMCLYNKNQIDLNALLALRRRNKFSWVSQNRVGGIYILQDKIK